MFITARVFNMVKEINGVQKLQFELMKKASFNDFNGERVVKDLEAHLDLWQGVVMKRDGLIPLRDIKDNFWNIDTLYILAEDGKEEQIETRARTWNADVISWLGDEEAHSLLGDYNDKNYGKKVLFVWWD